MSDEELLALPVKGYGPPIEEPTSRPSRDQVEISKPKSIPVRISKPKNKQPKQEQAPSKTFVKSQDASKQTETLNFEKNKEIDRVFDVRRDEVPVSNDTNELNNVLKETVFETEPKIEQIELTGQSDSNVPFEFDFMKTFKKIYEEYRAPQTVELAAPPTSESDFKRESPETIESEKS